MNLTIVLPWPDKRLSPNARTHWAAKAKVTRDARYNAKYLTLNAIGVAGTFPAPRPDAKLNVSFTFHPKDKRRRDIDNLISATKAHRDGIADALNVNDSMFRLTAELGEPMKQACVRVVVTS